VVNTYGVWLKDNVNAVAQYEDGLIGLSEELAKYTEDVTKNTAHYERAYQDAMSGNSKARTNRPTKGN